MALSLAVPLTASRTPAETPVEELQPLLNASQSIDLHMMLLRMPVDRRPALALLFADLNQQQWAEAAGIGQVSLSRWLAHGCKMPYGAAFRLARVFGVPMDELFKGWV